ncbi:toll/interleukin-1 receptor domain-containing protein [Microbacterium sp. W4I20]|uniref:toll/interleukin-1 receptor domain-containing protein n=1 Tax=Microbacterium sp. W4I20 TaxID=3042262 RepID=UPI002786740C|nr:toll/interleukin-1 receptor domain-containing protein [Microbacterium sp. W4I20]MDQ0725194.1 hypothetical protein [Microbacterium sp. W4I20]
MAEQLYDAFISYRSTAMAQARAIKTALEGLGRARRNEDSFDVFLDQSSLRPGDLDGEILAALDRSHSLIVLLAKDTVESRWVDQEISHWLANGGAPDRLFLIRLDDIDLTWDDGFIHPEQLPPALRSAFRSEQKWIDLGAAQRRLERTAVAPIFAAIRDIPIESLLLEEAALQRRRQRTVVAIAATMAVLLVAAAVAGVWSLINLRAAQEAAALAQSEADAAQTILIGERSPVTAAEFALRAADRSDSASLRGAMLYAAASARHLIHSIDPDGMVPAGAVVGDRSFVIWDDAADPTLRVYDLDSGEIRSSGRVGGTVDAVHLLSRGAGVACIGGVPVVFDAGAAELAVHAVSPAEDGDSGALWCSILLRRSDGVVVQQTSASASGWRELVLFVDAKGAASVLSDTDGALSATASGDLIYLQPSSGSPVIHDRSRDVSVPLAGTEGMTVVDVDEHGSFLLADEDRSSWIFVRPDGDGFILAPVTTAPEVWDIAAITNDDGYTGEVMTIDLAGTVGVPARDMAVPTAPSSVSGNQYQPTVVRLTSTTYLTVFASTATLVSIESGYAPPDGWVQHENGWSTLVSRELDYPGQYGAEPVQGACASDTGLAILPARATGYLVVTKDGFEVVPMQTWDSGALAAGCTLVETAPALAWHGQDVVALGSTEGGRIVVGGQSAVILDGDAPIEVYTADTLAAPWRWITEQTSTTYAGESGRAVALESGGVVFIDQGRPIARRSLENAESAAHAPDASGLVVRVHDYEAGTAQTQLVTPDEVVALASCDGAAAIAFVPGAGFSEDARVADAPHVVGSFIDGSSVDCTSGDPWKGIDPAQISGYVIDGESGWITYRSADGEAIRTSWNGSGRPVTTSFAVGSPELAAAWSADGSWLAYQTGTGSTATARHDDTGWTEQPTLRSEFGGADRFAFLTDDGLLLAMNSDSGRFEIIDAGTARTLVSDAIDVYTQVSSLSTTTYDGLAIVTVDMDGGDDGTLTVPISRERLHDALCEIHLIGICAS